MRPGLGLPIQMLNGPALGCACQQCTQATAPIEGVIPTTDDLAKFGKKVAGGLILLAFGVIVYKTFAS
jgi:hypothetical protein